MTTNQLRVAFIVSDFDCDPDDVTEALGVQPDEVFRRGEAFGHGARVVTAKVWRLNSPVTDNDELIPHVEWLMEKFPQGLNVLTSVAASWKAELTVAVEVHEPQGPSISLNDTAIQWLAKLTAGLDIDVYSLD